MQRIRALIALLALVLAGCATTSTAPRAVNPEQARKALAPSGTLRVAFLMGPLYATKDARSGELGGVAVDLGRQLAQRLGAPVQTVTYANPGALIAGAKAGEWDVAFMGVSAERAALVDFSAPYMNVEQGYLVKAGAAIASAAEVDRAGVRVGVIEKAGADLLLSGTLKNATLVRAKGTADLEALLVRGEADVIAATKTFLFGRLPSQPGARVLDGNILVEPIAMAVPKGREPIASSAVAEFVQDAKRSGQVGRAIESAGLKGVSVAP